VLDRGRVSIKVLRAWVYFGAFSLGVIDCKDFLAFVLLTRTYRGRFFGDWVGFVGPILTRVIIRNGVSHIIFKGRGNFHFVLEGFI